MNKKVSRSNTFELINFYDVIPEEYKVEEQTYPNYSKIQIKLPFRMLVIGASGSGKTNFELNLIKGMNCFSKIHLYAKDLKESLYRFLIDKLEKVSKKHGIEVVTYSDQLDDIPSVDDFPGDENTLVIFDDFIVDVKDKKFKRICDMFTRGRKRNISVMFLSQSYFSIPADIRKNSTYIVLKKVASEKDWNRIIAEYSLTDINKGQLKRLYDAIVSESFLNFLMIDLQSNKKELKYRYNCNPVSQIIQKL